MAPEVNIGTKKRNMWKKNFLEKVNKKKKRDKFRN